MDIRWEYKAFQELNANELYAILALRSSVFVVEQHCVYQDMDGKDMNAHHLMGWQEDSLVAYSRLLSAGISYDTPSIGRVVVKSSARKQEVGKQLMQQSISLCRQLFGSSVITIGAQLYLKRFYESFGFVTCSEVYDEDGIDHIKMILQYP